MIPEPLFGRHSGFWRREHVDKPLLRTRDFEPLKRGGRSGGAALHFENNKSIDPRELTAEVLLPDEPEGESDGDIMTSVTLPGICWTEALSGCPISMVEGGAWADPFLPDIESIESYLTAPPAVENSPWFTALVKGTESLAERTDGRFPIEQPLLRGPIDIMASAIGHGAIATAFIDFPDVAGAFLDVCTDIFNRTARAHLDAAPPFRDGRVIYGIWTPGEVVRTQLDNAVLFSPDMYEEHFLPRDRKVFEAFENTIIHVHSGSLHIAGALASARSLGAVQVSIDIPAGPSIEEMLPALHIIQETKPLVITGPATRDELDLLVRELDPTGLCLDVGIVA